MGIIEREPEVIDNLTSTSTIDALSAKQGRILDSHIIYPVNSSLPTTNRTLIACTGTVSIVPAIVINSNASMARIEGRLRISSFVRTGANPGITIKTGYAFPKQITAVVGFRFGSNGNVTPEIVNAILYTNGDVVLTTTETTNNAPNGDLYFMFYGCPIIF